MGRLLFKLLFLLQVPRIFRYLNRNDVIILTYHGFTGEESFTGIENDQGMHLHIDAFRRHLDYLRAHYCVIPLSDVVAHYKTGRKLPRYPAVVTIDDGYRSVYTLAYPALKEFSFSASIFVTTDFVDNRQPLWYDRIQYAIRATKEPVLDLIVDEVEISLKFESQSDRLDSVRKLRTLLKSVGQDQLPAVVEDLERKSGVQVLLDRSELATYSPLTWPQVAEMVNNGLVSVGSHTKSHVILSRCSSEHMSKELILSKQIIEKNAGVQCDSFCYPNGAEEDFDARTKRQLEKSGYCCGLTTITGANGQKTDVMELKRFSAPECLAEFAITISGARLFFGRHKRRLLRE